MDSASDTSSIRDSVDLAARDLALQTLLLESRANDSFIEEHNDARQSKSCGTSGEKDCLVDKTTPTANLVNLKTEDRGALDPQSMRSELRLGEPGVRHRGSAAAPMARTLSGVEVALS